MPSTKIRGVPDNLQVAAQFAYDERLSKPYTNLSCQWDWGYPDNSGPIWRPNHGLAHSVRGAMYAPHVIEYYKSVTGLAEYNFSAEDIEKIQIALMFRVAGRENESGFSDDKVAYASYQEGHAKYFREFCVAHPSIFKDQAEIDKYAQLLKTYANPTETSPLAVIFKTCHNLDLIRVRDPDGLKKELAIPTQILGETNVKQLMLYADRCIRATGSRILCTNPIISKVTGQGSVEYEDGIFRKVSTDVQQCLQTVANVSKPSKPIIEKIPAKEITAIKDVLLNYSLPDVKNAAISLYSQSDPVNMLQEVAQLVRSTHLNANDKMEILKKAGVLFAAIFKHEIPLSRYQPLVDYLTVINPDQNTPDAVSYTNLLQDLKTAGLTAEDTTTFEAELKQAASQASIETQKAKEKQSEAAQKPSIVIDADSIINFDLFDDPKTPDVADSIKAFADALMQKNIEFVLKINLTDLTSPYRADVASVHNYIDFTHKITESVVNDLFKAKSAEHQQSVYLYYCRVMQACMQNKDYNSVLAIYKAISDPAVQRIKPLAKSLPAADRQNILACAQFFDRKNPKSYYYHKESDAYIPAISMLLVSLKNGTTNLTQADKDGAIRVDMKNMSAVGKVYEEFNECRRKLRETKIVTSNIDLDRIQGVKTTTQEKRDQYSKRIHPDKPFNLDAVASALSLDSGIEEFFKLLNDNLTVPINIEVEYLGVKATNQTFEYLLDILEQYKDSLLQEHAITPQPESMFERLAILSLSIKEYGDNNKLATPNSLARLNAIENDLVSGGITADFAALREGQMKINKFKKGMPSLMQLNIPLPMGPLVKNTYTMEYEKLLKGMLAGHAFTVTIVNGQTIVSMKGDEYNLQEIIKYANLNQLVLSDLDKEAYMRMLENKAGTLKFPPTFPSSYAISSAAELQLLDDKFSVHKELQGLTKPERMALNIYTTGFYDDVNPFLRSGSPKRHDNDYIKELICHAGVAIVGLNKISDEQPVVSFRAETLDPLNIPVYMQNRMTAAKTGGVTMESGFISTAQEKPKLTFGDPDVPGGVGIIFKDLKGKNVRNLSAFPQEREFLMPPTQIQWVSSTTAKKGYLLEGRPVATLLDLAPQALTTAQYLPTKEAQIVKEVAKVGNPAQLLMLMTKLPKDLMDNEGNIGGIAKMDQAIKAIINDPKRVEEIATDPLKYVPELIKAGIVNRYGILEKCVAMIAIQQDINQKRKAEADFATALKGATSVDELIQVINNFSKNSYINVGTVDSIKLMTEQMDEIAHSPELTREIFENHTLPFDKCEEIIINYNINQIYFDLVAKQHEAQLHAAVEAVKNATSLNELIDAVRSNIASGMFQISAANKMIDNMRHYANNPEIVHGIANQGDKGLFFKNSLIPKEYGIRTMFIQLAKQQDRKNKLNNMISEAKDVTQLIDAIVNLAQLKPLPDELAGFDIPIMIENIKAFLTDPDMLQGLNNPKFKDVIFKGTQVPYELGIQAKILVLAKEIIDNQEMEAAAKSKKIPEIPKKPDPMASSALSPPKAAHAPLTADPMQVALDSLFSKNFDDIKSEHDVKKSSTKKILSHFKMTKDSVSEKGKLRDTQMKELAAVFGILKANTSATPQVKASQACAYLMMLKDEINTQGNPNSTLINLCNDYIQKLKIAVNDDKIQSKVEQSDWKFAAALLKAEANPASIATPLVSHKQK